jgi:hypothetical protein
VQHNRIEGQRTNDGACITISALCRVRGTMRGMGRTH